MDVDEPRDVEIGDDVAVGDDERLVDADRAGREGDRAGRVERFRLDRVVDADVTVASVGKRRRGTARA